MSGVIAYTHGDGEEPPYSVRLIRPDGTHDVRLLHARRRWQGGSAFGTWSKDGQRLLFARLHEGGQAASALWTTGRRGQHFHRIPLHLGTVALFGFDWSPSGRRIVFAAGPALRRPMIYTIGIDGRHRRALRRGWYPTWSAHGGHIAFMRRIHRDVRPGHDTAAIGIMRPDGTRLRILTDGVNDWNPAFSPDGRRVAYVRNFGGLGSAQWRIADVDGSHDTLVRSFDLDSGVQYCEPRWTPDGRRLAAIRTIDGPTDNDPSIAQFTTITPSGTDERIAFTFPLRSVARYSMCFFSWRPVPR